MALSQELRPAIMALVIGVILVFVGMTAASITGGVGEYVVTTLNDSVNGAISGNINMFSNTGALNLMSTVFVFAGIALLVYSIAFIIKALWGAVNEMQT